MEIYLGCTDSQHIVDSLMLICCGIIAMTKMICCRVYASNLTVNFKSALQDYLIIEDKQQRAIMLRHAYIGRTLLLCMVGVAYFDSFFYSLVAVLNNNRHYVNMSEEDITLEYTIPSRCFLEYIHAPRNMHNLYCFIELVSLILVSTSNFGNDSLSLHITLHICGQVKILKDKFLNFDTTQPQMYDRYNALIQRHGHLMEMAKKIAEATSIVLLVQLFMTSLLLCIVGFQFILALKFNNFVMMGKSVLVLNVFLIQITIYSFVGDYLKTQMEEIGQFVYQSDWYELPQKLSRNLAFIIMRAQSPAQLQAGNFIVVNLRTYMIILKTSISYLSVLRVMLET